MHSFPFYKQLNAMDCGATCLKMIAKFHGKFYRGESIRNLSGFSREGVSLLGITEAAEKLGFSAEGVQLTYEQLTREVRTPSILHWNQNHFVVFIPSKLRRTKSVKIADPELGIVNQKKEDFLKSWACSINSEGEALGTILLLETTPEFYSREGEKDESKISWKTVFDYMKPVRQQILLVLIALLITSFFQLIFPFLTQSLVDNGINTRNLQYITMVLVGQLMLVFSRSVVDFIRSRLLLNISMVVNLSLLSDFWIKLTRLPIAYFDTHHTGDTLQRINDNKVIQGFLSGSVLNTLFSTFNFLLFSLVLLKYNTRIFLIFCVSTLFYFFWIQIFLKIRRKINYQTFFISAKENNSTLQLVQGMQEIKLHNAEQERRWEWEEIQVAIFKLNFKTLTYNQLQQVGALLITQGKDIVITFLVAKLVLDGQLTFGAMLAIQYIVGQLSSPVEQFVSFIQNAQDAKISVERLNEIRQLNDEEDPKRTYITQMPENKTIKITNLSFAYPGMENEMILKDINLLIPEGKTTAIVGSSGSGKTTLLKILLSFYDFYTGEIKIGDIDFSSISPSYWRKECSSVLQEGFIFDDSISRNITIGDQSIDEARLKSSCVSANILDFIESLPNGFNTQIGRNGLGISQGQKQRLLIARAIYKNPTWLFFDEATNALDANNERLIVENLQLIFKGKTVLVVAHRLSTIKQADQIVVLDQGEVAEIGTHYELIKLKGKYFELIHNQLELLG